MAKGGNQKTCCDYLPKYKPQELKSGGCEYSSRPTRVAGFTLNGIAVPNPHELKYLAVNAKRHYCASTIQTTNSSMIRFPFRACAKDCTAADDKSTRQPATLSPLTKAKAGPRSLDVALLSPHLAALHHRPSQVSKGPRRSHKSCGNMAEAEPRAASPSPIGDCSRSSTKTSRTAESPERKMWGTRRERR